MLDQIFSQLKLALGDSSLIEISQVMGHGHRWLTLAMLILIPLSIIIFVRELMCWFYKANKILRRLERLERKINVMSDRLTAHTSDFSDYFQNSAPVVDPHRTVISSPTLPKASSLETDFKKRD